MWIGLNDQKNQMNFEWSDDSPVVYTNWNKGEPNNYHGSKEDCVALRVRLTNELFEKKRMFHDFIYNCLFVSFVTCELVHGCILVVLLAFISVNEGRRDYST